jgi:hypothetical protein
MRDSTSSSSASSANAASLERVVSTEATGGWFARLATLRLRRREALRRVTPAPAASGRTETERADAAVRAACVKCALTGAASGGVTSAAELLTAETKGLIAIATVPTAILAIGGEMLFTAAVHLDLTFDLAEIFGVPIENDPTTFWWLYALAFGATEHDKGTNDPGRRLVERVLQLTGDEVADKIGAKLLGDSVISNVVPGVAIAASSISNWVETRRLGETVQQAMLYHRAFHDALRDAQHRCAPHRGLLAEGQWFLFTADGRLSSEETFTLASLLRSFSPAERTEVLGRFVEDDYDWLQRLGALPEGERDDFFQALEVAATVDEVVSLPERRILRSAARILGRTYDDAKIGRMVKQFDEVGVLKPKRHHAAA